MIKFEPIDTIYSKVTPHNVIRNNFSYKKEFWTKNKYNKEKQVYDSFLIDKNGIFLSGLLKRLIRWCEENNLKYQSYSIKSLLPKEIKILKQPHLIGIELREDQIRLIRSAKKNMHGVLKSPTGSGKTVMAAGIISMFNNSKTLFLCHTTSLLLQTIKEFKKFGIGNITQLGAGKNDLSGDVVVSTMQSFIKIPTEEIYDTFQLVIVDECHRVSSFNGTYAKILTSLMTPLKFGFTATLPTNEESKYALEALIGPVIDEISLQEGIKTEILAAPSVKLLKVTLHPKVRLLSNYQEIYKECIVNYRLRNRMIIDAAIELNKNGKSCIIYVNKIDHVENLLDIANRIGFPISYVMGNVENEKREDIRQKMQTKEIMTTIATVVWKEGINIKSVDAIIIGGGGKSEIALLQSVGRGFRRDLNKDKILIIDFLDSGKYLAEHCIERLGTYSSNGWI